jgi:dihydropteroate synthase
VSAVLRCGARSLDLSRPRVMGIVNVTPDSFSDGGRYADPRRAIDHARALVAEGADLIDVGGESTRPGAAPVDEATELARVLPVVEALARDGALVSIDTMKPAVLRAAIAAGASVVNDVRALAGPGALEAVSESGAAVCLMHMRGTPRTMQAAPEYADVVAEVRDFLDARVRACVAAGIARERIVVDPGFGFGKTLAHNLALLARLAAIGAVGRPVMAGLSRKSMLAAIVGRVDGDRLAASLAAAIAAVAGGAAIVRVHDVKATVDALAVWRAVGGTGGVSGTREGPANRDG